MKRIFGLIICSLLAFATPALAQSTWPTPQTPSGGPTVTGGVSLCINGSGYAVPCSSSTSIGTVTQGTAASSGPWIFTPWIAGAVNSATNGLYVNLLQGNAVISGTNPLPIAETYANLATNQVTVGVTATLIVAARTGRKNVTIFQEGNTLVRVGASGVTLLTGVPLIGTQGVNLVIDGGAAVYGIAGSSELVSFMEVY
jgi:hypothetical protein